MTLQIIYLLYIAIGSLFDRVPDLRPMLWPIAVYVWHLLVLPVAVAGLLISQFIQKTCCYINLQKRSARPSLENITSAVDGQLTRRQVLCGASAAAR